MTGFLFTGIIAILLQSVTCGNVRTKMVFEAFSYGDDTSYQMYMGEGVSTQNGTYVHFKDPLVNMWGNQILVHKVTMAIVEKLEEKAFVVFNGTGTDKETWMTQGRILNSSFTDINTEAANVFSVEGSTLGSYGRRAFYMNKLFDGCEKDVGWIQVLVGKGYCPWEITASGSITLVSYIPQSIAGVWHNDIQNANSMRIYIEYEEIPETSTGRITSEVPSTSSVDSSMEKTESTTTLVTGKMTTEVPSTSSIEAPSEKTSASTTTFVTDIKESSTSSSSTESVITEVPSTSSISTEETATSTTTLIKYITCPPCAPCGIKQQTEKNMTLNELKEAVEQLKSQLRIEKTTLSSSIRSRTSAEDKRPSATAIGGVIGGAVTAAIFGAIVLPDIISLFRYMYVTLRRWNCSESRPTLRC